MKNILCGFISFLMISSITKAQQAQWWEMMQDPSVNFYDVQQEFNNYWNGKTIEKGKGWKQYKRWEYFMEQRLYPTGDRLVMSNFTNEAMQFRAGQIASRNAAGNWNYIGNPTVPTSNGGAGRVNCIAFHPTDPDIILVGTPAGGLWRTTNGGSSWITNTDDLPSMGISSIAFDPLDPSIVYMATGDSDGADTYSTGIFRSTDGGISWNATGFSFQPNQSKTISKILVHPTVTSIIIISANDGIYRSADSGTTWSQVMTSGFKDMEFKPDDPSIVYASRPGRFFRSTDTAQTFIQITDGLPTINSSGRHAIAVTPANPNYVYLLASNTGNGFYGFYRSIDAGVTFTLMSDSPNLLGWSTTGSDTGGQAWYDLAIAADRVNADIVYIGGVNTWTTSDGGISWSLNSHWYGGGGAPYVHADVHAMEMSHHTNQLYIGCDGGIYRRELGVNDYDDLSNNLQIGQIYRQGGSASNPDLVITGWQDNGTNLGTANWDKVMGGDGMECIIHPNDPQLMYASIYYGEIRVSTDGGDDFNSLIESNGSGVDGEGEWVTPYILSPSNPGTMYVGKSQVYKSTNGGASFVQIGSIPSSSSGLDVLAVAPTSDNYIYAARDGKIFVSTNGMIFNDRSSGLPSFSVTGIAISNTDPSKVWVSVSGYSSTSKVYYSSNAGGSWVNISNGMPAVPANCIVYENNSNDAVYVGTDIGVFYKDASMSQWVYFSNGLPNTIVNELEIHYGTGMIRAATYGRGLWESPLYTNTQNDISISGVADPADSSCGSAAQPKVFLFNNGDNSIISAVVGYSMDNATPGYFNWTGNLIPGDSTLISLPAFPMTDGGHTFSAWTSSPNGNTDSAPGNDTLTISFTHVTANIPVVLEFKPDCFSEETNWNISSGASVLYSGAFSGNYIFPNQNEMIVTEYFCLAPSCYTFNLSDNSGNGLHGMEDGCEFNGDYLLYAISGDTLVANQFSDSDFGSTETYNFCTSATYYSSFSISQSSFCEGTTVQYSDLSSAGTNSWNWNFPGGIPSTSTSQNPVVLYPSAGNYNVTLVSSDGAQNDSLTISNYVSIHSSPAISFTTTDVLCFGNNDAKIVSSVNGGTLPVQNFWSDNSSSDSIYNLMPGTYSLIVHDANGCRDTASASVSEPPLLVLSLSYTDATCGVADGTISGSTTGGTGIVSAMWSDSVTSIGRSGLDIGSYIITITDENGCTETETILISNPNAPVISSVSVNESCGGDCNGSLSASITGGTGEYTLSWTDSLPADTVHSNICPGSYILTVTDSLNCSNKDTLVVLAGVNYPVASFIPSDTTVLAGQNINFVNISSGGVTYNWSFGDGDTSPFSSTSHSYSSQGTFTVILIVDNGGCTDTAYFEVTVDGGVGITETFADIVKIYPNPATSEIIIDFGIVVPDTELFIYDLSGRLAGMYKLNNKMEIISLNGFAKGIYEFRFRMDDSWMSKKIVVQ